MEQWPILARSANLPEGLYILLALISIFFFFFFNDHSETNYLNYMAVPIQKIFDGNIAATSCVSLVKIGPVTPEIVRVTTTPVWKRRQKSAYFAGYLGTHLTDLHYRFSALVDICIGIIKLTYPEIDLLYFLHWRSATECNIALCMHAITVPLKFAFHDADTDILVRC